MARRRSPLLVEAHWDENWTHMYVLKRIYGSGSPWNTIVVYNDSNSGEETMNFADLMKQIEGAASRTTIQVWHY